MIVVIIKQITTTKNKTNSGNILNDSIYIKLKNKKTKSMVIEIRTVVISRL